MPLSGHFGGLLLRPIDCSVALVRQAKNVASSPGVILSIVFDIKTLLVHTAIISFCGVDIQVTSVDQHLLHTSKKVIIY